MLLVSYLTLGGTGCSSMTLKHSQTSKHRRPPQWCSQGSPPYVRLRYHVFKCIERMQRDATDLFVSQRLYGYSENISKPFLDFCQFQHLLQTQAIWETLFVHMSLFFCQLWLRAEKETGLRTVTVCFVASKCLNWRQTSILQTAAVLFHLLPRCLVTENNVLHPLSQSQCREWPDFFPFPLYCQRYTSHTFLSHACFSYPY